MQWRALVGLSFLAVQYVSVHMLMTAVADPEVLDACMAHGRAPRSQ